MMVSCGVNRNLTILIVEDNSNDVLLLQKALTKAGITNPVRVVEDGVDAINYLRGADKFKDRAEFPFPSVIFTDLKMPRMGGFEVLEWLRSHPECSVLPVIVFTNSRIDEDIRRAYQLGANSYIVKPQEFEKFVELLRVTYEYWSWCEKPFVPPNC
ncbi:MAG: CheY-like response regulator receiver domain protein [Pedosphaera sp.]|nr:CheY-like response regulator receiver domain protein [Pedosphaera sp.]